MILPQPNDCALRKKQSCAANTALTGLSRYYDGGASLFQTSIVLNIQNVPGAIIATPFCGLPQNKVQLL